MYTYKAIVQNVVDGDTIDVKVDLGFKVYSKQRIRLTGIDTPERGQLGFKEAGDYLRDLILDKEVTLITSKTSKWGYFLGEIKLGIGDDEINVNQELLKRDLAHEYNGGSKTTN